MAKSKLVQLNLENDNYSVQYNFMYSASMLSLGRILIPDLVVTNLFMHSPPCMILLYIAASFFTLKVFLHEIHTYIHIHAYMHTYIHTCIYVCIHADIHKHTHIQTDTQTHIQMCKHTYMQTYIHIHAYTHTYTYIQIIHKYGYHLIYHDQLS